MKKLLILLILLPLFTIGQFSIYDSVTIEVYEPTQLDTVDVIMLVCDTAERYYIHQIFTHGEIIGNQYVDCFENDTVYTGKKSHKVWWRFGKEVLKLDRYGYRRHKEYLDELGYKLPEGYIIWDTKQINQ